MSRRNEIDTAFNVAMAALFCLSCAVFAWFAFSRMYSDWQQPRPAYVPPAEIIYADENAVIIERVVETAKRP